jgi:hypothetical protein
MNDLTERRDDLEKVYYSFINTTYSVLNCSLSTEINKEYLQVITS